MYTDYAIFTLFLARFLARSIALAWQPKGRMLSPGVNFSHSLNDFYPTGLYYLYKTRLPFYLLLHSIPKGKKLRIVQIVYLVPHVWSQFWMISQGSWANNWRSLIGWFKFCRSNLPQKRQYTRCDKAACAYFVAAICRTNSNQFEFVRQIAATKFFRSDNDFHMSHDAICCSSPSRRRVAAICCIVCLGLFSYLSSPRFSVNFFVRHFRIVPQLTERLEEAKPEDWIHQHPPL